MRRPLLRRPDAAALARRVAVGIGLRDLRALEARVEEVGEQLAENAVLARPLEEQVRRLERSLVPVLQARARALARAGGDGEARAGNAPADRPHG